MREFLEFISVNFTVFSVVIGIISFPYLIKKNRSMKKWDLGRFLFFYILFLLTYIVFMMSLFYYFPNVFHFFFINEPRNIWLDISDGLFVFIRNNFLYVIVFVAYAVMAISSAIVEKQSWRKRILWIVSPALIVLLNVGFNFLHSFRFIIDMVFMVMIGLIISLLLTIKLYEIIEN